MGILHALSSTFTTCACGAQAKNCALSRMAAFVDATPQRPPASEPPIDLGPLVGTSRGFRTRERIPSSGGMSGVEMDVDDVEVDVEADGTTEDELDGEGQPIAGPSRHRDYGHGYRGSWEWLEEWRREKGAREAEGRRGSGSWGGGQRVSRVA